VHRTSLIAAGVGAVLSPVPLLDELLLMPVYGGLLARIGREHGLSLAQVPWRPALRTAFNGLLARAGLNLAVAYIPGVAAVANAVSAAVLTEIYGDLADRACSDPAQARAAGVQELAALLRDKARAFTAPWRGREADAGAAAR
jgi:uncharacterized protein (DUF697 family)